jgi:hypothetical protein
MNEKIVIGGFASDTHQIQTVCKKLSEYYDEDVAGMNFREARQNQSRLAHLIKNREVITHSAGFVALQAALSEWQAEPESIVAVAPPVPERIRRLVWRGFLIGAQGVINERGDPDHSLREELIRHARDNFGALPLISRFNAFDAAFLDATHGIPTTVATMKQDRLFPERLYLIDEMMNRARKIGTKVIGLTGDHLRFTHEPVEVMAEIDRMRILEAAV